MWLSLADSKNAKHAINQRQGHFYSDVRRLCILLYPWADCHRCESHCSRQTGYFWQHWQMLGNLEPVLEYFRFHSLMSGVLSIAEFILEHKHFFYRFVACAFPFFEVMSIWPIDQYQNATSRVISLHELKKFNFKSDTRSWHRILLVIWKCSAWLFIASSGIGVWIKTLQLIAKP